MTSLHSAVGGVNFAHYTGIESVGAAITFAILYFLLMVFYVYLSIKLARYHILPAPVLFFCSFRMTTFTMCAVLAWRNGFELLVVMASVQMYDVGFLSLLYSAYMVVRDREISSNSSLQSAIGRVICDRTFIDTVFFAIFILNFASMPDIENANRPTILRTISIYLLYALTVLITTQGLEFVVRQELSSTSSNRETVTRLNPPYPMYAICTLFFLLLVRQTFFMVTSAQVQNNEKLFYPLTALTEFAAACLLLVPWEELVGLTGSSMGIIDRGGVWL